MNLQNFSYYSYESLNLNCLSFPGLDGSGLEVLTFDLIGEFPSSVDESGFLIFTYAQVQGESL